MITITGCALAAAESAAPQTAVTQAASRSAAFWRASAIDDVEAAYRMLREDHPGAAPEVGDGQFQKTAREGPFVPSELYEGDIRDTPALEAWVPRIAAKRADNP